MSFAVEVDQSEGYTHITLRGPAALANFEEALAHMRVRSRLESWRRALFDLRQVEGALSFTEQFLLGEMAVKYLNHLDRVASLVPPERRTRTSEQVANQRGMKLRVFTEEDEAVQWLGEASI